MSGSLPPTYGELYRQALERLPSSFEAGQVFAHCTGLSPHRLPLEGERTATGEQAERLTALCTRREAGEPLQYLLGEWEFYGLPLFVGGGVLIPRPETELLVDLALDRLPEDSPAQVLDLCAGSGCIAIAIAHCRPRAQVTAVELSAAAFAYLARNSARHGSRVEAVQGDLREYRPPLPVDLLVSNPPYVSGEELARLQAEVRWEPALALDGGGDGLDFYREIARCYRGHIRPGGTVLLEVGMGQSGAVERILEAHGFSGVTSVEDLNGIPRVVMGTA